MTYILRNALRLAKSQWLLHLVIGLQFLASSGLIIAGALANYSYQSQLAYLESLYPEDVLLINASQGVGASFSPEDLVRIQSSGLGDFSLRRMYYLNIFDSNHFITIPVLMASNWPEGTVYLGPQALQVVQGLQEPSLVRLDETADSLVLLGQSMPIAVDPGPLPAKIPLGTGQWFHPHEGIIIPHMELRGRIDQGLETLFFQGGQPGSGTLQDIHSLLGELKPEVRYMHHYLVESFKDSSQDLNSLLEYFQGISWVFVLQILVVLPLTYWIFLKSKADHFQKKKVIGVAFQQLFAEIFLSILPSLVVATSLGVGLGLALTCYRQEVYMTLSLSLSWQGLMPAVGILVTLGGILAGITYSYLKRLPLCLKGSVGL